MPPQLRTLQQRERNEIRVIIACFILVAVLSIPLTLYVGNSVLEQHLKEEQDKTRRSDLYSIQRMLRNYASHTTGGFPDSLSLLSSVSSVHTEERIDPTTKTPYDYRPATDRQSYELCALLSTKETFCLSGTIPEPSNSKPTAPAGPSRNADGVFSNPDFQYSMKFPTTWIQDPTDAMLSTVTFMSPDRYASVQTWVVPASETMTIAWFADLRKRKLSLISGFQITKESDATFKGMSAHRIEYTWTGNNGHAVTSVMLSFIHGGLYYEITETASSEAFTPFASVFEAITESFEFI